MSQKKVINIWKRTNSLMIKKNHQIDLVQRQRNFIECCYQLPPQETK